MFGFSRVFFHVHLYNTHRYLQLLLDFVNNYVALHFCCRNVPNLNVKSCLTVLSRSTTADHVGKGFAQTVPPRKDQCQREDGALNQSEYVMLATPRMRQVQAKPPFLKQVT